MSGGILALSSSDVMSMSVAGASEEAIQCCIAGLFISSLGGGGGEREES